MCLFVNTRLDNFSTAIAYANAYQSYLKADSIRGTVLRGIVSLYEHMDTQYDLGISKQMNKKRFVNEIEISKFSGLPLIRIRGRASSRATLASH